ncbi:MAG: metallophosphoesterase family protein [Thermodesulfobacteriota bacterium]
MIAKDATWHDSSNTFKVWVLSDIQPRKDKDREAFKEAVLDINKNVPGLQMAIVGGDIANRTKSETYDWYLSTRDLSYIKDWNEIAGNHDLKTDLGKLYREKIKENFNYSVSRGNILFIFMSDEVRGKPTGISDETFNWWKELVINNQDKIIVVMTHAPLEGSGIPYSYLEDRQVTNSMRFTDVLKEYKVDIWFSGHLHLPHFLTNNIVQQEDYNGTIFINVSSIRPEMFDLKNLSLESLLLSVILIKYLYKLEIIMKKNLMKISALFINCRKNLNVNNKKFVFKESFSFSLNSQQGGTFPIDLE